MPIISPGVYAYHGGLDDGVPRLNRKDVLEVIVDPSVTIIKKGAFFGFVNLVRVTLPDTITRIESGGFMSCRALKAICLPKDLEFIGRQAFQFCDSLEEIRIPSNVREIDKFAFHSCKSLRIVYFPISLQLLETSAFRECPNLEVAFLPHGLKKIMLLAFSQCKRLRFLNIPETVVFISSKIVLGCDDLLGNEMEYIWVNNNPGDPTAPNNSDDVNEWLRHRYDDYPLHKLCFRHDINPNRIKECVDSHGEQKAKAVDYQGMTAMHIIAANPHATSDTIRACYDANPVSFRMKDRFGCTPFQYLLKYNATILDDSISWLLWAGARSHLKWQDGMEKIIQLIIDRGEQGRLMSEIDETTGLNIFLLAAAGEGSDLSSVFEILVINPAQVKVV